MRRDPVEQLARGLAWGLLAAPEWTRKPLVAAAAETLGHRYRLLGPVVDAVLAAYRTAPVDRPYEFARFLVAATPWPVLVDRARVRRRPVRIHVIAAVPGEMGRRRWPVPPVDDLAGLARLLSLPLEQLPWVADVEGRQRRATAEVYQLYRYRWVTRPGAVPRLLESPTPILRAVSRRLLTDVLSWVPVHPAAHGFATGRSALTNARAHVGAPVVVGLDLQTFFASIGAPRVNGLFRSMGYPEAVARTLTGLCTHTTPAGVLARMPAGGDSSARYRLRAELRGRHLPQGTPTSPALSNLACYVLDRRLAGYAAAAGLTYTRYADDLTFSGGSVTAPRLVRAVTGIATEEGFRINLRKTRVRTAAERQLVTGVVTNAQLGVPREDLDRLRAVLHDARRNGPDVANRDGHPAFREHLEGRVGWVAAVNPGRGRKLQADLDAVVWPER